jgi:hypothetical protein
MEWNKSLKTNEMINVLHEQGELHIFDPVKLYKKSEKQITKKISKIDKIREENKKIIDQKFQKQEKEKVINLIKYLKTKTLPILIKEITEFIYSLSNQQNCFDALVEYLIYHYNIKCNKMILDLFIVVCDLYNKYKTEKAKKILKIVTKYIDDNDIDLIKHQMTTSPQYMPPLSPFENVEKKLEQWQLDVLKYVDEKKSVLIIAPTSSGKTACMNYIPSSVKGRCLYVVPSTELAKQVAGMYRRSLKGGVALLTNKERFFENDNWKILIGTPYVLENYLVENNLKFDYVVYDEIQKLNPDDYDYFHEGASFERIIKIVKCPLMALTATIENPLKFKEWLENVSGNNIELVIHKIRPIIQQLHEYDNGKLNQISRFDAVCDDDDFIKSYDFLNIPLTSSDIYNLYYRFESSQINELDPDDLLCKRITLTDIEDYKIKLLSKLQTLNIKFSNKTPSICNDFSPKNFVNLFKTMQNKEILPAILFKLDEIEAIQLYEKIIEYLEEQQNTHYPHHRDDLFWLSEQRKLIESKIMSVDKIKVPLKETDPVSWIEAQKEKIEADTFNQIKTNYCKRMQEHIINASNEKEKIYYQKQISEFLEYDTFPNINPYGLHEDFVFHKYPLSEDQARNIRRKLIDNLRSMNESEVGFNKFSFNHIFLKGVLRGIVLYVRSMPTPFQHVVQSLVSLGMAPIIISDDSLAYGVNFPIKTTIITGSCGIQDIDVVKAHQMMGRSGRRGIDREGHVVFMGVDWKNILKKQYSPLVGDFSVGWYSKLPTNFDSDAIVKPPTLREVMLNVNENYLREEAFKFSNMIDLDEAMGLWNLRWCDHIKTHGLSSLEFVFENKTINESFTHLVNILDVKYKDEVADSFIKNGISKTNIYIDTTIVNQLKMVGDFLLGLYPYTKNRIIVKEMFGRVKHIWDKYQL